MTEDQAGETSLVLQTSREKLLTAIGESEKKNLENKLAQEREQMEIHLNNTKQHLAWNLIRLSQEKLGLSKEMLKTFDKGMLVELSRLIARKTLLMALFQKFAYFALLPVAAILTPIALVCAASLLNSGVLFAIGVISMVLAPSTCFSLREDIKRGDYISLSYYNDYWLLIENYGKDYFPYEDFKRCLQ